MDGCWKEVEELDVTPVDLSQTQFLERKFIRMVDDDADNDDDDNQSEWVSG